MAYGLSGKSVVVTGAANGFGLATARQFVRAGASVVMADLQEDKLEQEVETLNSEGLEGQALGFNGDMREKLTMRNLMSFTLDAFDDLHVLVNGASLLVSGDPLDPAKDQFDETLQQNVVATLRMSQIAARLMIECATDESEPSDRSILNVSSIFAQRSMPEFLAFSVSSAAIDQITRSLATALAPHRIRVNAVSIGGIVGRSLDSAMPEIEDLHDAMRQVTPLGQPNGYRETAQTALFLSSPASRFTTGQILAVDGGRMLLDPLTETIDQPDD